MPADPTTRITLANRLRALSETIPAEVTDRFLERHPDWITRYGDRARQFGIEDARYHLVFLATAVEVGSPTDFENYALWTARVLESRGIDRTFLAENLAQVHEAISGRLRPADMEPVHDCMKRAIAALAREAPSDSAPTGNARFDLTRKTYLQAILAGERRAAMGVANEALRQGASTLDLYVEVLQASLYEVGRQWETNKITVAREHAATAITQAVMAHLYDRLDRPGETKKGRLLITGIGGELHSVGALMVADVLESCGWNVRYLGTDLPEEGILDSIREHDPASIGISATMAFNVPVVGRLIEAIRKEHGESKRVMVGGGAFRQGKDLWRQLGADGFARDLRDAIGLFG